MRRQDQKGSYWKQQDTHQQQVRRRIGRGLDADSTPRARARAFLYPTRVFQPCRPAITGDGTGAYIVTIVHGERDALDGARFLRSDVEGEPPRPVDPCNTRCPTERLLSGGKGLGRWRRPSPDQLVP
jgi:hypothetical protein